MVYLYGVKTCGVPSTQFTLGTDPCTSLQPFSIHHHRSRVARVCAAHVCVCVARRAAGAAPPWRCRWSAETDESEAEGEGVCERIITRDGG